MSKIELDYLVNNHMDEYIKNIKNMGKKYRKNVNENDAIEIISQCYIKCYERIEREGNITNLKGYFGMMTYNLFCDQLKIDTKEANRYFNIDVDWIADENSIETTELDEIENQKLILDIFNKLNEVITPLQFNIFINKNINKKSCKKISIEFNLPYRFVTAQYQIAKACIEDNFLEKYKKINEKATTEKS